MFWPHNIPPGRAVLVSDFDGTLARPDFYQLVHQRLVPAGTPNYWDAYRAGKITHFDALKAYFEAAEGGELALIEITRAMELPEDLPAQLSRLRRAGWDVVIVSAGCTWYIQILLDRTHVQLPVFANPGHIEDGRLIMERPVDSPFYCPELGIDKASVVRSLQDGRAVAFAGDGFPDLAASRLVPEQRRFARHDLATACREAGLSFRVFEAWSEVAAALVER